MLMSYLSRCNLHSLWVTHTMLCLHTQQSLCHMQAAAADKTAKQRLGQLDTQLNELKKEQAELTKQWEKEKEEMQRLQSIKNEIDRVNLEIQSAERDYDLNRAAELKYGTVLQLQKQLKEAEEALEKQAVRPLCQFGQSCAAVKVISCPSHPCMPHWTCICKGHIGLRPEASTHQVAHPQRPLWEFAAAVPGNK